MTSDIRLWTAFVGVLTMTVAATGGWLADTVHAQVDRRRDADTQRVIDATAAFLELTAADEKSIPRATLARAEGIAIFPQAARVPRRIGQGPNTLRTMRLLDIRGRGILSVRGERGTWSPPALLTVSGGSFPEAADVVLVIVSRRGLESAMRHEFDIDRDATVAPGPIGRDMQALTEVQQRADIFGYLRSRGVLSGLSLNGSILQGDTIAHQRFYGKPLTTSMAVAQASGREPVAAWQAALDTYASR